VPHFNKNKEIKFINEFIKEVIMLRLFNDKYNQIYYTHFNEVKTPGNSWISTLFQIVGYAKYVPQIDVDIVNNALMA
jgi:hypothetical protein